MTSVEARFLRYQSAVHSAYDQDTEVDPLEMDDRAAHAVMAVADAEVAAAVSEAQAALVRVRALADAFADDDTPRYGGNVAWHIEEAIANEKGDFPDAADQRIASQRERAESAEAEVERLREGLEALHRPWYEVNGVRHDHTVPVYGAPPKDHVCRVGFTTYDNCLIDPESPEESEHYVLACSECRCATDEGHEGYLFWPCPTIALAAPSPAEGTSEAVHWVGDAPTSLHGNGAASFTATSRHWQSVTCTLCLSLRDRAEGWPDPATPSTEGGE